MAASFTWKINIETGDVELVKVENCTGEMCKTLTAPIESALGIVEDFKELPEFFQTSEEQKQETES